MRWRITLAAALVAAAVTACSSSGGSANPGGSGHSARSGSGQPPGGTGSVCRQLASADRKLTGLGSAVTNPGELPTRLAPVIKAFESLKANAPADVSAAVDDLLNGMRGAEQAMQSGDMHSVMRQIVKLRPKMQHDAEVIGRYLSKHCGAHA